MTDNLEEEKSVGFLLAVGIFLMPYIFSWATLQKGYSTMARVISFAWLAFAVIAIADSDNSKNPVEKPSTAEVAATEKDDTTSEDQIKAIEESEKIEAKKQAALARKAEERERINHCAQMAVDNGYRASDCAINFIDQCVNGDIRDVEGALGVSRMLGALNQSYCNGEKSRYDAAFDRALRNF